MMRLAGLAILVGLLVPPLGAEAEEACQYQPALLSLADSIIEKREDLSGFPKRNFGTEAAYLKIRYGQLADDETEALLARLIEGRARLIGDLAFAWSYGKESGATNRLLGPSAIADVVSSNSITGMRAMIDAGAARALVGAIADQPDETPFASYHALLTAAIDLPDQTKAELADLAMEYDEPLLAAGFAAIAGKPAAWASITKRLRDPALIEAATQAWHWTPALVGNPELPPAPGMPVPADPAARAKLHELWVAAALEPQVDFLSTLLNQTGKVDEVAAAATAVRLAIEAGTVERDGLYGPAWLIAYRVLRQTWGDLEELESQLSSFQVNIGTAGGASPRELLDILIAVDALGPYVRGETSAPPAMPDDLSTGFQGHWPRWVEVADRVKAGDSDPSLAEEATLPIAAELLLAAGKADALAALVAAAPTTSPLLRLATDVAIRLDRLCESYLAHPTEALQLNGQQIYKFAH